MWSPDKALVFALVAASSFTSVHVLEFCQSSDGDCHNHDDNTASNTVKSRWNVSVSNLIQDLEQFRVCCKKLIGKKWFLSLFRPIEKEFTVIMLQLNIFLNFCRSIPNRWGWWQLCSHCKELHILQIHSNPTERPVKTGSCF